MFERKKPRPQQKRIDCLIGAGTTVRGDIIFSGGLRIDGKVAGRVIGAENEAATLVISEQACVDGSVEVSHVVVNGAVNGPVMAKDYLELQAKARVVGDVLYGSLELHVGAVVDGKLAPIGAEMAPILELKRAGTR